MVRRGVSRGAKRGTGPAAILPSTPPALSYAGGGEQHHHLHHIGNGVGLGGGKVTVVEGVDCDEDHCPQCGVEFNTTKNRKVTDTCGHTKCRNCLILAEDGCTQCEPPPSSELVTYGTRKKAPTKESPPPPVLEHRMPTTRRAAAAAAAAQNSYRKATNSRTSSINSGRPTSSSPGSSVSNDTRLTSSVYSDDSNSCIRFPGGVIGTSADTIDLPTLTEITSPNLVDTSYIALSDDFSSVDNKSYSTIVSEESEFSKGLMSLRKCTEPLTLTSTSTTTSSVINNNNHPVGQQAKDLPSLGLVSVSPPSSATSAAGKSSSPITTTSSKRLSRDSPERVHKLASGGGSPDITQGVPRDFPRARKSSSPPAKAAQSPIPTSSRLSALLTRSQNKEPNKSGERVEHSSPNQKEEKKDVLEQSKEEGDDDEDVEEEEEEEDEKQDEEPVPKKKKKRSPVVIHDHITILGGDPPMYQCNLCQKKFKTKAHIKYHEFCQKGDKPFKCEQCGQGFIAKSHYEYHLRTHTGERPYVCPKCGKGFNQRGKVTRHMRSHTGEKPFICQECNRGFANAQALRSHTLIHTGERPFACTYCNKRFTGMTNLKKHVITHTGERPFSCNHCGKSFGLKWTLDLHLRTHSSERPYACDQCSRAFSNSKDLRRHLVIHSGERPFKCWICGTAFRRKDNLDRHIKNTHNQPKEVAKKLANEAAAAYLKETTKNQSLGNIPVSKVNSVVISNIIKNADLMPPGGIVPNNPPNKQKGGVPAPSAGASTNQAIKKGTPSSKQPPSVQTPSTSSTSPSGSGVTRRRVIITAPLSPPSTRKTRSKDKEQKTSPANTSPSAGTRKQRKHETRNSTPPPPPEEVVEKQPKEKKKKKKKSKKRSKGDDPKKSAVPSSPVQVETKKKEKKRKLKEDAAQATSPLPNVCDAEERIPRLTLVIPSSPKVETENEVKLSPPPSQPELSGDRVECILPHDIDEVEDTDFMDAEPQSEHDEEDIATYDPPPVITGTQTLDSVVEKLEDMSPVRALSPVEILRENETDDCTTPNEHADLLLLDDSTVRTDPIEKPDSLEKVAEENDNNESHKEDVDEDESISTELEKETPAPDLPIEKETEKGEEIEATCPEEVQESEKSELEEGETLPDDAYTDKISEEMDVSVDKPMLETIPEEHEEGEIIDEEEEPVANDNDTQVSRSPSPKNVVQEETPEEMEPVTIEKIAPAPVADSIEATSDQVASPKSDEKEPSAPSSPISVKPVFGKGDTEGEKTETLPAYISDFVLSVLDADSRSRPDDLESISSESLPDDDMDQMDVDEDAQDGEMMTNRVIKSVDAQSTEEASQESGPELDDKNEENKEDEIKENKESHVTPKEPETIEPPHSPDFVDQTKESVIEETSSENEPVVMIDFIVENEKSEEISSIAESEPAIDSQAINSPKSCNEEPPAQLPEEQDLSTLSPASIKSNEVEGVNNSTLNYVSSPPQPSGDEGVTVSTLNASDSSSPPQPSAAEAESITDSNLNDVPFSPQASITETIKDTISSETLSSPQPSSPVGVNDSISSAPSSPPPSDTDGKESTPPSDLAAPSPQAENVIAPVPEPSDEANIKDSDITLPEAVMDHEDEPEITDEQEPEPDQVPVPIEKEAIEDSSIFYDSDSVEGAVQKAVALLEDRVDEIVKQVEEEEEEEDVDIEFVEEHKNEEESVLTETEMVSSEMPTDVPPPSPADHDHGIIQENEEDEPEKDVEQSEAEFDHLRREVSLTPVSESEDLNLNEESEMMEEIETESTGDKENLDKVVENESPTQNAGCLISVDTPKEKEVEVKEDDLKVASPSQNQNESVSSILQNENESVPSPLQNRSESVPSPLQTQNMSVPSPPQNQNESVSSILQNENESVPSPLQNRNESEPSPLQNQNESVPSPARNVSAEKEVASLPSPPPTSQAQLEFIKLAQEVERLDEWEVSHRLTLVTPDDHLNKEEEEEGEIMSVDEVSVSAEHEPQKEEGEIMSVDADVVGLEDKEEAGDMERSASLGQEEFEEEDDDDEDRLYVDETYGDEICQDSEDAPSNDQVTISQPEADDKTESETKVVEPPLDSSPMSEHDTFEQPARSPSPIRTKDTNSTLTELAVRPASPSPMVRVQCSTSPILIEDVASPVSSLIIDESERPSSAVSNSSRSSPLDHQYAAVAEKKEDDNLQQTISVDATENNQSILEDSKSGVSSPQELVPSPDSKREDEIESSEQPDAEPTCESGEKEAEPKVSTKEAISPAPLMISTTVSRPSSTPSPSPEQSLTEGAENEKPEATLPPDISDFVLSILDQKSGRHEKKPDDLESISSESLASPQSEVENSIKMCIRTLESDPEDEPDTQVAETRPSAPAPQVTSIGSSSIFSSAQTKPMSVTAIHLSSSTPRSVMTAAQKKEVSTLVVTLPNLKQVMNPVTSVAARRNSQSSKSMVATPKRKSPVELLQVPEHKSPPMVPQEERPYSPPTHPTLQLVRHSPPAQPQPKSPPLPPPMPKSTPAPPPPPPTPKPQQVVSPAPMQIAPPLPSPPPPPPTPRNTRVNGIMPSCSTEGVVPPPASAPPQKSNKRPISMLGEGYQAVPTRVQFILPKHTPPVPSQNQSATVAVTTPTDTSATVSASVAYDPSLLYFVQPDGQQAMEGNYQLVYAAAAATAEREEGSLDGPPNKVRLLYAEALGVGPNAENGNELQFFYAAATPDQQVRHTQNAAAPCHVQLMEPCRVTYSRSTNEATSEILQYQVQTQPQQQQQQQTYMQQTYAQQPQQQVLNLSVNTSPVYYYSTSFTQEQQQTSQPLPPVNHDTLPQQQQPQPQPRHYNPQCPQHGMFASTSTAKLMVANHTPYMPQQLPVQQQYLSPQIHDLSQGRRLELPVHTARNDRIAYAHVQPNDPMRHDLLEKAREVQHVFPHGALRHCKDYTSTIPTSSANGLVPKHRNSFSNMVLTNGGSSAGGSATSTGGNGKPLSGLDLLTEATERMKELQYEALCTERAAAAIAAVGELARMRRLGTQQQQQQMQQQPHRLPPPQQQLAPQHSQFQGVPSTTQSYPISMSGAGTGDQCQYQRVQPPFEGPPLPTTAGQQAGIRRGPRKYYLSRSANLLD